MITKDLDKALEQFVVTTMELGVDTNSPEKKVKRLLEEDIQLKVKELTSLVRAEAINLADKIIGKDRILHNLIDENGEEFLDPIDKAIFDHQVQQRLELAKYQNQPQLGASGPEDLIDSELSENEA
jgi:uncharacterized protein (DUF1778 family)